MVSADLLASFYEVTLDHNAFDKFPDILINPAAVQDLFHNADLLLILLAGVGMIGVDENSRVFQIPLLVLFEEELDIFIMVVGNRISVFVYGPSEDRVGERIPFCPNFPASGDKIMSPDFPRSGLRWLHRREYRRDSASCPGRASHQRQ